MKPPQVRRRRAHFKNTVTTHPDIKRLGDWFPANVGFFKNFREWLADGGYQYSAQHIYGAAARLALGLLVKPYWTIDPKTDIQQVRDHLAGRELMPQTKRMYNNGLDKLVEYLCHRCHKPLPERNVDWDYYLAVLPPWLATEVRLYVQHCLRTRRPEDHHRAKLEALGALTMSLRWIATHKVLNTPADFTPDVWFEFVEARLAMGIKNVTINIELYRLQAFLHFLEDGGQVICKRTMLIKQLHMPRNIPKDAPLELVKRMWEVIEVAAESSHGLVRRFGLMDRAWFLLMLHSGLRSCEIRRLMLSDIDWEQRRLRIEQSKGMKDRFVYLSEAATVAVKNCLVVRGPAEALPSNVFIHQHQRLGKRYFQIRLRNYGKTCGIKITPHQLRHTCATLLLNAGAPILTVQMILGHKFVTTTLGYARLYDGTVAADYYRAMAEVERRLPLIDDVILLHKIDAAPHAGKLLALVDSLRGGTLNESQTETLHLLRAGIMAMTERDESMKLLKSGTEVNGEVAL